MAEIDGIRYLPVVLGVVALIFIKQTGHKILAINSLAVD
jgi:hypothetical protein